MRKLSGCLLLVLLVLAACGRAQTQDELAIDTPHGEIGHQFVRHISAYLPGRVPFSTRELEAALWIEQMLLAKGFDESRVRLQTFSYDDVRHWEDFFGFGVEGLYEAEEQGWFEGHEMRNYSQNVIAIIPGVSAQTIIIGAHYDSLRYPGTSDNASGTGLLLENAARMLAKDNYYTLVYVFFGAHEIGMLGTFYFYESLSMQERENILFVINADVLIEGPDLVFSAGFGFNLRGNALTRQFVAISEIFYEEQGIQIRREQVRGGDQWVSLHKGYTTLAFWGIDPENFSNFLHSERDCYDYIDAMFPGMIERAMRGFALFLEKVLLEVNT
ncbi:MAG: M28 family peptidase [Clostridiales bacterium]|jgi:hypothetical protein|nr:M28 family peptidase [Clostridiales bacterium]